jgi:hypothetical protein
MKNFALVNKINFLTLTFVVLTTFLIFPGCGLAIEVTFPDSNFEQTIRNALGKPTGAITDTDLAGLLDLDARLRGIKDITGVEYCIQLTSL